MLTDICLIGNPNCGKTTLFNALTGTYQRVGNFAGVTVEKKDGVYRKDKRVKITDLPGLYSLEAVTNDEKAVINYLKTEKPQAIINILDGTNLERNLYLTLELLSLNIPIVLAVNMCDDLDKNGIYLNAKALEKMLGVPVVKISALKNKNIDRLMQIAVGLSTQNLPAYVKDSLLKSKADAHKFLENNIAKIITQKHTKSQRFTMRADQILTHKTWGIPIFICVIILVYYLSSTLGGGVGGMISNSFESLSIYTSGELYSLGVSEWAISLLVDAVISGVGTVLSFLPQILVLFALLTVIEESGYAARIAFNLDRVFRSFGLGGKSMLPVILSCGCTVTGLMATRGIENENERRMTVFLTPFMPCGAKTAVFSWFAGVIFGGNPLVSASMYFLSIVCMGVFGKILMKFKAFRGGDKAFILEMPTLRMPSVKDIFFVLYEKIKDFLFKAGTVIFTVSVVLWFLQNVGLKGYANGVTEDSFLYIIGSGMKYIFYPLGFGSWQASVSVLSGLLAKEAVIESLAIVAKDCTLFENGFSAYAFMAFILLSPPCVSALGTAKRELKSGKWFAFMLVFQFLAAYAVALIINTVGKIYYAANGLILSLIIAIIIVILFLLGLKHSLLSKCNGCGGCLRSNKCRVKSKRNTTI